MKKNGRMGGEKMEGGEMKVGKSTKVEKVVHTTSRIVRLHKRKPAEIHAHTVQLTSVNMGRPKKFGDGVE
jgi:hypothetical protein